ncbi:MAG: VanW family protein [Coriobacteriales bacterium]|jgi:vancomycin resistance protein YoaR|nr:VanW family protein [Coriobacteriales bacterium]
MSPNSNTPRHGRNQYQGLQPLSPTPARKAQASSTSRLAGATATRRSAADRRTLSARGRQPTGLAKVIDRPWKLWGAIVIILLLLIFVVFYGIDGIANFGKIHSGVTVAGVKVGGLTPQEAAAKLETELNSRISATPVDMFDDEIGRKVGATDSTVRIDEVVSAYENSQTLADSHSWRITAATLGVTVNGTELAEQAYAVGRGGDFWLGRIKARFGGVELPGCVSFNQTQLSTLEQLLTGALGYEAQNADIVFDGSSFVVTPSKEGYGVDHAAFADSLNEAFLGNERSLVVPLAVLPVSIDEAAAQTAADACNQGISSPIQIVLDSGETWDIDGPTLAGWISTNITGEGAEARLLPRVDVEKLRPGLQEIIGDNDPGIAPTSASFTVSGEGEEQKLSVVPAVDGSGIDYNQVATDFNTIIFDDPAAQRSVRLNVVTLQPEVSTAEAEGLELGTAIASFTTEYPWATPERIHNVHLAADLVNGTLIAPDGEFSFNSAAGECTEERGFQMATAFYGDQIVDEIGGGVCQVATTVYNAFWEAGMPIVERTSHMFYMQSYPAGRDAAVYWPAPDLICGNDTGSWMLLTVTWTDYTITATLWGTDPGYTVETIAGEFVMGAEYSKRTVENPDLPAGEERIKQEGVDGRSIQVRRIVYNSEGEVVRDAVFYSIYAAQPEIKEIGTKEE